MKQTRLPSMVALRAFEAVARVGSIKEASAELYVTPGAVSQLLKKLEEELSLKLFERKNNKLFLTGEGRKLQKTAQNAFEMLRETVKEISTGHASGSICIACEATIAQNWLASRFDQLLSIGGGTNIRIITFEDNEHIESEAADIIICKQQPDDIAHSFEYVGNESYSVLAAPSYLNRQGLKSATARSGNTYLKVDYDNAEPSLRDWLEQYPETQGIGAQEVDFGKEFGQALDAARSGAGLLLAPLSMVSQDLELGRLSLINGMSLKSGIFYWVGSRDTQNSSDKVQSLVDWVITEMRASLQQTDHSQLLASLPVDNVYQFRSHVGH